MLCPSQLSSSSTIILLFLYIHPSFNLTYTEASMRTFSTTYMIQPSLFLFFSFSPFHPPLCLMLRYVSRPGSSNLFFVVLLSPPLPGLPTLSRASEIEEGAKLFGGVGRMGTRERLSVLQVCSRWTFIWFGRLWNGRPSCVWDCLRWRGFLMSYVFV